MPSLPSGSHDITARRVRRMCRKGENCRLNYPSAPEIQQDTILPRQGERWRQAALRAVGRRSAPFHLADQLRGDRQPQTGAAGSRLRESSVAIKWRTACSAASWDPRPSSSTHEG